MLNGAEKSSIFFGYIELAVIAVAAVAHLSGLAFQAAAN